uniref:Uncharacterized protein n=1 Tax=Ixodes ricinus TaxID=34613 RepID=A0A6B0U8Y4_IXORI
MKSRGCEVSPPVIFRLDLILFCFCTCASVLVHLLAFRLIRGYRVRSEAGDSGFLQSSWRSIVRARLRKPADGESETAFQFL